MNYRNNFNPGEDFQFVNGGERSAVPDPLTWRTSEQTHGDHMCSPYECLLSSTDWNRCVVGCCLVSRTSITGFAAGDVLHTLQSLAIWKQFHELSWRVDLNIQDETFTNPCETPWRGSEADHVLPFSAQLAFLYLSIAFLYPYTIN